MPFIPYFVKKNQICLTDKIPLITPKNNYDARITSFFINVNKIKQIIDKLSFFEFFLMKNVKNNKNQFIQCGKLYRMK